MGEAMVSRVVTVSKGGMEDTLNKVVTEATRRREDTMVASNNTINSGRKDLGLEQVVVLRWVLGAVFWAA